MSKCLSFAIDIEELLRERNAGLRAVRRQYRIIYRHREVLSRNLRDSSKFREHQSAADASVPGLQYESSDRP